MHSGPLLPRLVLAITAFPLHCWTYLSAAIHSVTATPCLSGAVHTHPIPSRPLLPFLSAAVPAFRILVLPLLPFLSEQITAAPLLTLPLQPLPSSQTRKGLNQEAPVYTINCASLETFRANLFSLDAIRIGQQRNLHSRKGSKVVRVR